MRRVAKEELEEDAREEVREKRRGTSASLAAGSGVREEAGRRKRQASQEETGTRAAAEEDVNERHLYTCPCWSGLVKESHQVWDGGAFSASRGGTWVYIRCTCPSSTSQNRL